MQESVEVQLELAAPPGLAALVQLLAAEGSMVMPASRAEQVAAMAGNARSIRQEQLCPSTLRFETAERL